MINLAIDICNLLGRKCHARNLSKINRGQQVHFDAVFDTVGGETYTRSFSVLKKGGCVVSMGEQPNKELMEKYRVNAITQFTQVTKERLEKLTGLVEQGVVKAHIDKVFSLDEAAKALNYLETGIPKGKVVIKVH